MRKYFETFGHTCELDVDEDKESLLKDMGWIRRTFIKWTTIDPISKLTLQHFGSHSSIVNERKFHLTSHPITVHPFSRFKFVWEGFMVLVLLCGLIYSPLQYMDFVDHEKESKVGNLEIMKWVKAFCILDMITRFFAGYFDERNFVVELCKKQIARRYLRGLFTFDFLVNIPFLVALLIGRDTRDIEFHYIQTFNLFRIFRLRTFVRYCQRMLQRCGLDDKYLEIVKLTLFWIICIHWAACLHIIPGVIVSGFNHHVMVNAWYEKPVFRKHSAFGKYVICLFKSVKTFMGTGYIEDLKPTEHFDRLYVSLLTIVGRIGLCVTLAYIFETIQGVRSSTLKFDELTVQLNNYSVQNKLPLTTKAKLKNNYDYMFRKRYFNEQEILKTVSAPLRQQILIHNTRQLVENSPFFENLPSYLILKIISALSVELYLKDDVIYSLGEVGTCVYFISSGSVAFYSPSGREVCHFADGDYFGEMTLVSDTEHHYGKVVALETTECYKLGKIDFLNLVESYPDLLQKVEALTIERIEQVLTIEEREKYRQPYGYASINHQRANSRDRQSTNL